MGADLKGKTIGVLGTGNIGEHVIRIANGFEMRTLAYCHNPKEELTKQYGVHYVGFNKLISTADIITLHIPYKKENHQLMKMNNVIITPHTAWYSKEGLTRILDTTIENIESVKKRPKNRVA